MRLIPLLLALFWSFAGLAQVNTQPIPGRLLLRLAKDAPTAAVQRAVQEKLPFHLGAASLKALGEGGRYHLLVVGEAGADPLRLQQLLKEVPGVEATQPDHYVQQRAQPNDPQYGSQWHLADMNVESVWNSNTGGTMANGKRIAVGIIDSGVQGNHPDLAANMVFAGAAADAHGTQVAGVVGAVGNNGEGVSGVNWDVDLVSPATVSTLSDAFDQFQFCLNQRNQFNQSNGAQGRLIVALTVSWGAPNVDCGFGEPIFDDLGAAGVLVVTSGPNDGTDIDVVPDYPGTCPNANNIVVTSYGQLNQVPFAVGDNTVHLLAPGLDIPTTDFGGGYATVDGNSFAIPNVAGAIALLYANDCITFAQAAVSDPQATAQQVKQAILSSVAPFPGGGAITITGGKLDVHAAYQALAGQCAPCIQVTLNLNTAAGAAAQCTLLDGLGNTVAQGSGEALTFCVADGCFTATVVDGASQPLDGSFTATIQGTTVASGSIVNGQLSFTLGTVVNGCTDPTAFNYDPNATCDDGSCCTGDLAQIAILTDALGLSGTVNVTVTLGGTVVHDGPLPIADAPGYGVAAALLDLCEPNGCLSVVVGSSDVPLASLSVISFATTQGNFNEFFQPTEGYFGAVGELVELCDGLDNDCDGEVDEDFLWYADADGDGFGNSATEQLLCSPPVGSFVQQGGDCDDTNADVNPVMADPCSTADGLDNDCNGTADDGDLLAWYPDLDGDGFGADVAPLLACSPPADHVENNIDCDDANAAISPVAADVCDGADNDCDGLADEDFLWFADVDGDGFGDDATAQPSCSAVPGAVQVGGDCDDTDATVQGGVTLFVVSESGFFQGSAHYVITQGSTTHEGDLVLADLGDDYAQGSVSACLGAGCFSVQVTQNDVPLGELGFVQIALNPGQNGGFLLTDGFFGSATPPVAELCDGLDNDCDGLADEDFLWYADVDGDGVGDVSTELLSCTPVPDFVQVPGDCNDADPNLTTLGAACNDGDPNTVNDIVRPDCSCLGFVPGDCPPGEIADCNGNCAPAEWVGDGTCDDGSFEHNGILIFFNCAEFGNDGGDCGSPCGPELCDGLDNDCDGEVDEDFLWYVDADGDGFGFEPSAQVFCSPPAGRVQVSGDCDDDDATINPGALDACDGVDRNCDGVIPGTTGTEVYSPDWTATATTGESVNLFALLAQGKTVVVDLFAAWCPPSQQMLSSNFLQDWNAHMGPAGTDQIRIVAIAVDQNAGSVVPFINSAQWPVIVEDGESFGPLYNAIGMYNNAVPTLLMICPDRSVTMLYGGPDLLPYTGLFQYDAAASTALLNERCGCRNACVTNIGCMDVNACDYDPTATCPGPCAQAQEWFADNDGDGVGSTSLGTACTQPANSAAVSGDCDDNNAAVQSGFTLALLTEDPGDFGTAHYLIQQGGTFIEGDLDLPAETEGVGYLPVCIGAGCYTITITQNDVPLFQEAYLFFPDAPNDPLSFTTFEGYQGGGSTEVCDGLDNDCDGQVDEGFPQQYADNDGDGFGNALQPLPCDTPGVANPDDCDDTDANIFPGQGCGGCSAADRAWILANQAELDGMAGGSILSCNGNFVPCLTEVFLQNTPLGEGCATCLAQRYACIFSSCLQPCVGGFGTANCQACVNASCNAAYFACAGFTDADGDGVVAELDCDDTNASIYLGAPDICDTIDNDCDGEIDELPTTYFVDSDGDGFGDENNAIIAGCSPPNGTTTIAGDCDDADAAIFPGAPELCNGIDDDCNGAVDDNAGTEYFTDADGDGFGSTFSGTFSCTPLPDMITVGGDCDDADNTVFPGATELCDGIDQACDGGNETWYPDLDGDGFGAEDSPVFACTQPADHVAQSGDCDDTNDQRYPGGPIPCPTCSPADIAIILNDPQFLTNAGGFCVLDCLGSGDLVACMTNCIVNNSGLSENCAECIAVRQACLFTECPACLLDPGSVACQACMTTSTCAADFSLCSGLTDNDGDGSFPPFDCNDTAISVYPGANEICDGLDNDCDGLVDEDLSFTYFTDADGDGFGVDGTGVPGDCDQPVGTATQGGDCDDADDTVFPGAPELCDDVDNDCDGEVDDLAGILYFTDADGDSYGDDVSAIFSCTPIPGAVTVGGDCDDGDAAINPGAADPCDGIDQDCSGGPVLTTWFQDNDGDGFGNPAVSLSDCVQPFGFAPQGGDCDDTDNTLFPGNGCGNCTPTEQAWTASNQSLLMDAINNCTLPCLSEGAGCLSACLQDEGIPLGAVCLSCVEDYQACYFTNCLAACVSGPEACLECQLQSGCFATFASCLGMVDADGDGWWAGSDCDDSDPTVHPGATELCNGVDDDCDGTVDDNAGTAYYPDLDGDGFGADDAVVLSCTSVPGLITTGGDCNDSDPQVNPLGTESCNGLDDDCDGTVDEDCVLVAVKVFLEGPYDASTGLMNDGLRAMGLVPTTEPYSGLGYVHVGGGGETTNPVVLATTGPDAVVDWVVLEMRDMLDPTVVVASRSALLQRDGDVVDSDGISPVSFSTSPGDRFIAVRHRNHLGVMTAVPFVVSSSLLELDLRTALEETFGIASRRSISGAFPAMALWMGDVNGDDAILYTGAFNDRDPVLFVIGGTVPTNTVSGYRSEDVNLDGTVKYTGENNDRDPILQAVGGSVPTNVREGSVP
jgi:thiol-disulfide isomerase/thioredoxin